MEYVCISVPYFLGEKRPERTETAEIKATGFPEKHDALWVELAPDFDAYDDSVVAVNAAIVEAIQAHADRYPIIFAADCTSCFGAVKGLGGDQVGVVWYDAHGDFNTPETTPSGFLGGMPLAALVGRGNEHLLTGIDLSPVAESNIVVTDVRDLDPEEGDNLRASDIIIADKIDDLNTVDLPDVPLYVHLDVDILDPEYMPALNYPADGGPDTAAVNATLRRVATDGNTVGLLVSLWNADKARDDGPLQTTLEMVEAFLAGLEEKE